MSAYTKYRYCGWIDEIPEISEPGTYVLNPVGGEKKENVAYKIRPIGSEEYFVVEYRRKGGAARSIVGCRNPACWFTVSIRLIRAVT